MPKKARSISARPIQENPRAARLDTLPIDEVVSLVLDEEETAHRAAKKAAPSIAQIATVLAEKLTHSARIIYVGEGAAGRIAAFEATECGPFFGLPPSLLSVVLAGGPQALSRPLLSTQDARREAEQRLRKVAAGPGDVVGIVADGPLSPFLLAAVEYARFRKSWIFLLTTAPIIEREQKQMDCVVTLDPGPEIVALAKRHKSSTALKLCLSALHTATFVNIGKTYGGIMVDVRPTTPLSWQLATDSVRQLTGLPEEAALQLLKKAGGRAKIAIAMHHARISAARAKELLIEHRGSLRAIVGDVDFAGYT